jgi:hypothetical protein
MQKNIILTYIDRKILNLCYLEKYFNKVKIIQFNKEDELKKLEVNLFLMKKILF